MTNFAPNLAFRAGDQSVATPVENPSLSAPFEGDPNKYILHQKFQQTIADYIAAGTFPLDTPHPWPEFADYLFCSEPEASDIKAGNYEFQRTYCKIPTNRPNEGRLEPWQRPGLGAGGTNTARNVTAATNQTLTVDDVGDIAEGDTIIIYYGPVISYLRTQFFTFELVTNVTSNTITIYRTQPSLVTTQAKYVQKVQIDINGLRGRRPETLNVKARVRYNYQLAASFDVVVTEEVFQILDQNQQVTDLIDVTSTPTMAAYADMVAAGDYLVVSCAARRWNGNIWEVETVEVPAQ